MTDAYTTELQVRFRDIDTMGHVNNALYATYLEEARVGYFRDVLGEELHTVDTVLAQLELSFQQPIEFGDTVAVTVDIPELGESSIPMEYEIRSNGDVAATGETVQVVVDRESGTSRPIPNDWRKTITEYEKL